MEASTRTLAGLRSRKGRTPALTSETPKEISIKERACGRNCEAMSKKVPNKFPSVPPPEGGPRLAIIGQSPGEREEERGEPFVGPSGDVLSSLLDQQGIVRAMCFVGNVSQVRPPRNEFDRFEWEGPEVQEGIAQLRRDLEAFNPTMVLCLGNEALHLFKHGNVAPKKVKKQGSLQFLWPSPISSWRGSLFESSFLEEEETPPEPRCAPQSLVGASSSSPVQGAELMTEETKAKLNPEAEQRVQIPRPEPVLAASRQTGKSESCGSLTPTTKSSRPSTLGCGELANSPLNLAGESSGREAGGRFIVPVCGSPAALSETEEALIDGEGACARDLAAKPTIEKPLLKCVATYHPAFLIRNWDAQAYVKHDIRWKVLPEYKSRVLTLPRREIHIETDFAKALSYIRVLREELSASKQLLSVDTEGWCSGITVVGLSIRSDIGWVLPFVDEEGRSVFTFNEELELWQALKELFEDPEVPKILQNFLSDAFILGWTYGITLEGVVHDTLALAWEADCELDKDLVTLASLYTREPYWKSAYNYKHRLAWVCGMDAAVTLEVCEVLLSKVYGPGKENQSRPCLSSCGNGGDSAGPGNNTAPLASCGEGNQPSRRHPPHDATFTWMTRPQDHYEFNMECLAPTLYMMLRGWRFDKEAARAQEEALQQEQYALQGQIDEAAGRGFESLESVLELAVKAFGKKNPKEAVSVPRWQPMRFNGKKWVKSGKLILCLPENASRAINIETDKLLDDDYFWGWGSTLTWLKPAKPLKKLTPITITTWPQLEKHCKPSCQESVRRVKEIYDELRAMPAYSEQTNIFRESPSSGGGVLPDKGAALRGELGLLLGTSVNINSTGQGKDAQWLLYECWKLPKRFKKGAKPDGETAAQRAETEEGLTSDDQALLSLYLKTQDERLKLVLRMRALVKEASYLRAQTDADGRIRSGLGLLATPTGRMSSQKSPTGTSKLNMQTITKRLRKLFLADPGCLLFQRDLGGADGWTVAAHCARLGDPTMLEDFRAKLKPQSILALIYKLGPQVNDLSREELKSLIKEHVDESSWQYMAFKRVFHLSDYDGKPNKMSESILTDSWKKGGEPIFVHPKTCEDMQQKAFHVRYKGVKSWHQEWRTRLLSGKAVLETSYGHKHVFHGRKREWSKREGRFVACGETHRYALACESQLNTTHALKRAVWRMWHDPENYRQDGTLRAEPLMLVHDSKIMQARVEDQEWVLRKDEEWFSNPLVIGGVQITIPASSECGRDWSMK